MDLSAALAVEGGDAVAPPELAGDAPVLDVLHPVEVGLDPALGMELDLSAGDRLDGGLGQGLHAHEPLVGETGLHRHAATLGVAYLVHVVLDLHQKALLLQLLHHQLARHGTVQARELGAGQLVHGAVVVHDVGHLQIVAQAHFVVVGVVGGGDLHRASPEVLLHVFIGDEGDEAVGDGQHQHLPDQALVALVRGIHGHGGVAHEGLGTGGGHHDLARAIGEGIADVPEMAGFLAVDDLLVREGGAALGAPVDDAVALVDEAVVVEADEDLLHGVGEPLVEGEALAGPVAGGADGAQLPDDLAAILLLPLPDFVQELLATQVVAGQVLLLLEVCLHLRLGGNAGVVHAGNPAGLATLHLLIADQDVLQGVVEDVPQGEDARHVGRRDDDGVGLLGAVGRGVEVSALLPFGVPLGLHLCGGVCLG